MIELFLILSIGLNVLGLLYVRWILRQYNNLNSHLRVLFEDLAGFERHVESIHESEMYYGDSTLQSLIQHTKDLADQIEEYRDYLFPEEELGEYEDEEKEED